MRICFLASQYPPALGGISNYVHLMTEGLARRGHELLVITRSLGGRPTRETIGQVRVHRIPSVPLRPAQMFSHAIISSLRVRYRFKPDLLHVNHPGVSIYGKPCDRVVTTAHTTIDCERQASVGTSIYARYVWLTWPILRLLEKDLVEKSRKVICVSHHTAASVAQSFPTSRGKLDVVYNAVPEEWFGVSRKAAEALVLYVGGLTERKGLDSLLRAMTIVRSNFPRVKLVIVGSGALRGALARAIQQMGLGGTVILAGPVNDVQLMDLYSQATCFVLPSLYEDCPYSLLQAFAAGVPVISTRVGGIPEIVHNNETGLLVPPYDWSALSLAINRMLSDDELRRTLSRNEHRLAVQRHRMDPALDSLESVYAEVMTR